MAPLNEGLFFAELNEKEKNEIKIGKMTEEWQKNFILAFAKYRSGGSGVC